jgi:hypothetical protein
MIKRWLIAYFWLLFLGGSLKSYAACREVLRQKISEIYLSPLEVQDVLHRLEDLTLDSSGQPVFNYSYISKKAFPVKSETSKTELSKASDEVNEENALPRQLEFNFLKDPQETLLHSDLKSSYETILKSLSDPIKKAWAEKIFAALERFHLKVGIENYESWIKFLTTNRPTELNYRLYEGAYALSVLRSMNVRVAFEPPKGFFSRLDEKQASKSMDLRLSDPETGKVLAFREVKRIGSSYNVVAGVKSAFRKADFALTRLTERVELSAVLFIEGEIPEYFVNEGMHEGDFYPQAIHRIAYEFSLRTRPSLDSVLIINLKLKKFAKIYHLQNGKTQIEQGDFG